MSQSGGDTNVEETSTEEISTKRESIKVCVRIRPMNKNEKGVSIGNFAVPQQQQERR